MEEAATYWSLELTWQAFFAACVASYTIRYTLSGFSDIDQNGFIEFPKASNTGYEAWEVPFFMIIGVIGGLVGALFCNFALVVQPLRNKIFELGDESKRRKYSRIGEALLLLLITVCIQFWLPALFECIDRPANSTLKANVGQYDCGDGRLNKMAVLIWAGQEGSIHALFSTGSNGEFSYETLFIFAAIVFILTGAAHVPSELPELVVHCRGNIRCCSPFRVVCTKHCIGMCLRSYLRNVRLRLY